MDYKTRKEQIAAFIKEAKLPPKTRAEKKRFREAMRRACFVGACEERSHCLKIIKQHAVLGPLIATQIVQMSVLQVIGYEEGGQ